MQHGEIITYNLMGFNSLSCYLRAFVLKSYLKHLKQQKAYFSGDTAKFLIDVLRDTHPARAEVISILDEKYYKKMFGMSGEAALNYIRDKAEKDYKQAQENDRVKLLEAEVAALRSEIKTSKEAAREKINVARDEKKATEQRHGELLLEKDAVDNALRELKSVHGKLKADHSEALAALNATHAGKVSALQKENDSLREKIKQLEVQVSKSTQENQDKSEVDDLRRQVAQLKSNTAKISNILSQSTCQLKKAQGRLAEYYAIEKLKHTAAVHDVFLSHAAAIDTVIKIAGKTYK